MTTLRRHESGTDVLVGGIMPPAGQSSEGAVSFDELDSRYPKKSSLPVNVLDYGALADNNPASATTNDAAFAAAYAASKTVYVPAGIYYLTTLAPPTTSRTFGAGEATHIRYAGTGTFCTLTSLQRVKFQDIMFVLTNAAGTLFTLNSSFRCSWARVILQGQHSAAADSYGVTTGHIGVNITGNAGDNLWTDCDFVNLGVGIKTTEIQNNAVGCKFGTCYVGILGTSGGGTSGMSLDDCVFVSSNTLGLVAFNILIDANAGQWWITNTWFEGADVVVQVGDSAVGGPSQFGMVNVKLGGSVKGIDLQNCRQPLLSNVQLGVNPGRTPTTLLTIDPTHVAEGTAIGLINIYAGDANVSGQDYLPSTFPSGWNVLGRARMKVPTTMDGHTTWQSDADGSCALILKPKSASVTSDIFRVLDSGGTKKVWVDKDALLKFSGTAVGGTFISDDAAQGYVLKDTQGTPHYWRVTVNNSGSLVTTDLGTTRPTS